jgi:energy-coupling factor transporter ATP-binding protein EcfA2
VADPFAGIDGLSEVADDESPDYGKWLVHGPQGSGKTTLVSTLGQIGKTLFIDLIGEHGTQSFKGSPWEKNIDIRRPKSITALDDMFWVLASGKHEYSAVCVDSITAVQKMTMRFLLGHSESAVREIKQGTAPADIRTWGSALDVMTDFATFWYSLADGTRPKPMHVALTAQTKMIENEDTGSMVRTPDVQKGALSIMLAAPAYILYTDVEENIDAIGDESLPPTNHIVRFGSNPEYRTKARVPYHLRGKIPPILGRKKPTSLLDLSRVLQIGGVPAAPAKKAAAAG